MIFEFISIATLFCYVLSDPTGCSYDASKVLHTCDGRGWVLPLTFADFSPQPQRLLLKDVSGELPASAPNGPLFSGFSSINTALFDSRFSPALHIMCYMNGQLIITKETFTSMGWLEEVFIQDCDILSLPEQVFLHFGDVNSFIIQGGSISNMVSNSLIGLNVKKLSSAKTPKGEFIIRNCQINSGRLPYGVFFSAAEVETIIIDNAHITSFKTDTFFLNPKLRNLSLSHNEFSSIPEMMFKSSHSLASISIWGIQWDCTCSNLWFLDYAMKNNITVYGDIVCSSPAEYSNIRAWSFYSARCSKTEPCSGKFGVVNGNQCVTALSIAYYSLTLFLTVITMVAVGMILYLRRTQKTERSINILRSIVAGQLLSVIENKLEQVKESYARDKYIREKSEESLVDNDDYLLPEPEPEAERRRISTPLYWRDKTQEWPYR